MLPKARIVLLVIAMLMPFGAWAAGAGDESILDVIAVMFRDVINAVIGQDFADRVKSSALGLSGRTTGTALKLAGVLALANLMWATMMAMLEKRSVIASVTETLLFASIAAVLISNYTTLVETVYGVAMSVLQAVGLDVGQAFVDFFKSIFDPVHKIFSAISESKGDEWTWEFGKVLLEGLLSILILVVAAWFLLQASASMMGVFIMGPIFVGVGIVFGPIMCATLAANYTRQWFSQWLNFLVGASFLTVVSVVVMKLLSGVFSSAFTQLGSGQTVAVALGVAMLAAGLSKLFESIPSITDAIFPGRTGAGGAINHRGISAAANPVNHVMTAARGASAAYQGGKGAFLKAGSTIKNIGGRNSQTTT